MRDGCFYRQRGWSGQLPGLPVGWWAPCCCRGVFGLELYTAVMRAVDQRFELSFVAFNYRTF